MSNSTDYPPSETVLPIKTIGFEAHSSSWSQKVSNGPNFPLEKKKKDFMDAPTVFFRKTVLNGI